MNISKREKYLRRVRGFFHDTELIKVITGVRRCGKSCLMASIADELRETGIPSVKDPLPGSGFQKSIARSKRLISLTL